MSKRKSSKKASTKASAKPRASAKPAAAAPVGRDVLVRGITAAGLGWLIPGAGHVYLGRRGRGAFYLLWVVLALVIGCQLDGNLPWTWGGSPLRVLATLGGMGSGVPFFALRYTGYTGDIQAVGFEYGSAFILSAGLMNLLTALDAWDIALGRKE